MKEMLRTKAALLKFMRENTTWNLQYCHGVRSGWYWMRKGNSSSTVKVHASAAHALRDAELVEPVPGQGMWSSHINYRLKEVQA